MNVNFTLDTSQLDKLARFTNPKLFDRAIKAGIRQASSTAKTQAAKGIGSRYSLTAGRIKKDITVSIPPGGEFALLRFSRRPPSLAQFNAKPGTRGTGQQGRGRGKGWTKPAKPGKPMSADSAGTPGGYDLSHIFSTSPPFSRHTTPRLLPRRPAPFRTHSGPFARFIMPLFASPA